MSHQIAKSLLPDEESVDSFQRLCNTFIDELRAHKKQMAMVEKDPENYHPYPAPSAHPDIMASVIEEGDDYNIDFEIFDDNPPPPEPTLEDRKNILIAALNAQAHELSETIIPDRKQPLMQMKFLDAMKVPEEEQTDYQKRHIAEWNAAQTKLQKINRHVAEMLSNIDDLTVKTIDNWELEPFPEVA